MNNTITNPVATHPGRLLIVDGNHSLPKLDHATASAPFRTISEAAEVAMPGDTIQVMGGVYRERVTPPRGGQPGLPIVYEAAPGNLVIVKGSEIWSPAWTSVGEGIYSAAFGDSLVFESFNPYKSRLACLPGGVCRGQVFLDGEPLVQARSEEDLLISPGTWRSDGESLTIHFPDSPTHPEQRVVEVTIRERIFAPAERGVNYLTVRGFVFEHCANQFPYDFWVESGAPQAGAVGCLGGHHWEIAHNTIRWAQALGIDCGTGGPPVEVRPGDPDAPGRHFIHHNRIVDCGCGGIAGAGQIGTRILHNTIERTNCHGWSAPEAAGLKFHFFYDGLIEGNLLLDNDAFGIWLDNVWYGTRVTRNICVNNRQAGIFVEMGDGSCLVDNNVCALTRCGEGIYLHDSSRVTVAHNLLYGNAHFGLYARCVTERTVRTEEGGQAEVGCRGLKILNNLFIDNFRGQISLPLDSNRSSNNHSDHNLFLSGAQWHWEGLGFNTFVANTNDRRISSETLGDALWKCFDGANIPESERPNRAQWLAQPLLTLEWWRMLTGNDLLSLAPEIQTGAIENGAIEKGSIHMGARGLYLHFRGTQPLRLLNCPPIPEVESDLFAEPHDSTFRFPGPFQKIPEGEAVFTLWPLPQRTDLLTHGQGFRVEGTAHEKDAGH